MNSPVNNKISDQKNFKRIKFDQKKKGDQQQLITL